MVDDILKEQINSLPAPLSNDELIGVFKLAKKGDLSARSLIIERNLRLVINLIHMKYKEVEMGIEDLVSAGTIGLMKGVNSFDYEKTDTLNDYLTKNILYEIDEYLKRTKL